MLIKPVYLLEPEEDKSNGFSRRAFVSAVAVAAASGFGLGITYVGFRDDSAGLSIDDSTGSSIDGSAGDIDESKGLRRARALAIGSENELAAHWVGFMSSANRWPDDETLQDGVDRLAKVVLNRHHEIENRRAAAIVILDHVRRCRVAGFALSSELQELIR